MNLFSIVCLITVAGAAAVRQPGEFEPQAAVWLSAETNREDYMQVTADLVKALRPHVKIKMLLENELDVKAAKSGLKKRGVNPEQIQYFTDKGATLFLRDATVFTVGRKLGILDLKWSLYGLAAWCEDVFAKDPETKKEFLSYLDQGRRAGRLFRTRDRSECHEVSTIPGERHF